MLVVYGTRPEAIKMAPVVAELRSRPQAFDVEVCTTGQHLDMVRQVEELLALRPDHDLRLMRPDQGLNELAASALAALDRVVSEAGPDWVLVQGDTTTAMAASLAAFHRGVPVGHVEAGLRTGDLASPFPEEANRRIVDLLARRLFTPTERSADALRAEGVADERIHVVGNTVIDALRGVAAMLPPPERTGGVLVTLHRRESFGAPLTGILGALARLAAELPHVDFLYPVHPNPNVRGPALDALSGIPNVRLTDPLDYRELVAELLRCRLVLTDSGGIQEEAPTFGKPVLVLREVTERPEGIAAGVARVVGTDPDRIVEAARLLLTSDDDYRAMAQAVNPYGDGMASRRIADILEGKPWTSFRAAGTDHP